MLSILILVLRKELVLIGTELVYRSELEVFASAVGAPPTSLSN